MTKAELTKQINNDVQKQGSEGATVLAPILHQLADKAYEGGGGGNVYVVEISTSGTPEGNGVRYEVTTPQAEINKIIDAVNADLTNTTIVVEEPNLIIKFTKYEVSDDTVTARAAGADGIPSSYALNLSKTADASYMDYQQDTIELTQADINYIETCCTGFKYDAEKQMFDTGVTLSDGKYYITPQEARITAAGTIVRSTDNAMYTFQNFFNTRFLYAKAWSADTAVEVKSTFNSKDIEVIKIQSYGENYQLQLINEPDALFLSLLYIRAVFGAINISLIDTGEIALTPVGFPTALYKLEHIELYGWNAPTTVRIAFKNLDADSVAYLLDHKINNNSATCYLHPTVKAHIDNRDTGWERIAVLATSKGVTFESQL